MRRCARLSFRLACNNADQSRSYSSSSRLSRRSRVSRRYAREKKEIWMARNTADLYATRYKWILIHATDPSSARVCVSCLSPSSRFLRFFLSFFFFCVFFLPHFSHRASLFESLGFSANFLPSAPAAGERRVDSRPSSASKNCLRFFLSSIPRHRLCSHLATSVLTLIPGDPSTRVVALVTCRKCFSSMREKGSPSLAG